jgi:hypothetical protein
MSGLLYEVNTRVWLRELSEKAGHPIKLNDIPETEFERWKRLGFTHIWLMGVWNVGPMVREEALSQWRKEWSRQIPSKEEDVHGSPYAIKDYSIDARLGTPIEMLLLRDRMRQHGLKLILDFIPNHLGIDSEDPHNYSARFVQSAERVEGVFERKTILGKRLFAHGRDPYFPPWRDTVQLDYRMAETQAAMVAVAQTLVVYCDGLRCDMAMLLIPEIFQNTWKEFPLVAAQAGARDFWKYGIAQMKQMNPGADLIAEVYWGREQELQDAGFDFTYNKTVTDRLLHGQFAELQEFLLGCRPEYLRKSIHFLENHDEQRAAVVLPLERHKAAALLITSLPGLPLLHDGQLEGRKFFARIQMSKRAPEQPDSDLQFYYERLLLTLPKTRVRKGKAEILRPEAASPEDSRHKNVIVIKWMGQDGGYDLVIINPSQQTGRFRLDVAAMFAGKPEVTFSTRGDAGSIAEAGERQRVMEVPPEFGQILSYERESSSAENR